MENKERVLSKEQSTEIMKILKSRFKENMIRHKEIEWEKVQQNLEKNPEKLWSLFEMERTGGEPDVIFYDKESQKYIFYDCSKESPKGRRSLCYDRKAQLSRKEHSPKNNAISMADELGIDLLTEEEYRNLQKIGDFDIKTSSWIKTPEEIRNLGGALFCDKRYHAVFVYHNGAESYYASRGFRGSLKV